mgnify:CR=1 FL=1|tara:strand:+ start:1436 stop:1735 length:300 start_codon:yes stop_codon:yes gene_type:complete
MASKSLTETVAAKEQEKYAARKELEPMLRQWMADQVSDRAADIASADKNMQEMLKDGTILCALVNALKGGAVRKVHRPGLAFREMEVFSVFLLSCYCPV